MKRIRSLSLLLVLVLVVGLLPMTASAVYVLDDVECFTSIPVANQPLGMEARAPENAGYNVRIIGWYRGLRWETAEPVAASAVVEPGHDYWVLVEFTPVSAYMMFPDTRVNINHRPATIVEYIDAGTLRAAQKIGVGYWGVGDVPLQVTTPYVGESPRYLVDYPENDRYTASLVDWKKGTDFENAEFLEIGETFASGQTYWVTIRITPGSSYIVGDPRQITVNGMALDPHSNENPYNRDYYAICRFTPQWPEPARTVSVSVTAPEDDHGLSYRVASDDEEKYDGYVGDWYLGTAWETAEPMRDEESFRAGFDYWVRVVVAPKPGWYFPADIAGQPDGITMRINGQPAQHVYLDKNGYLNGAIRLHCADIGFVFMDVPVTAYYADAVHWAVEEGIAAGTSDTTFSPQKPCTRAQAVSFLWRAAGCPKPLHPGNPFRDVPGHAYYADAVLWAVEQGITKGTGNGTFSPNAVCTRAQIVCFLWNRAGRPAASIANPFTDVARGRYYERAVLWAVENGITRGLTPTAFGPGKDCTRAQITCFLYNDAEA